ncbi:SDR family oxidoreductase [Nocardia sp. NPDC005366]|uniref:SDR family oxidoreductase n=1 Tax=Nocardia sp. NPDC005366 TaxID=3156878 RepID=UPI0033BEF756
MTRQFRPNPRDDLEARGIATDRGDRHRRGECVTGPHLGEETYAEREQALLRISHLTGVWKTIKATVPVARYNIRVDTIHPNGVRTDMGKAPDPEVLRASGVDDYEMWLFGQVTATALAEGTQEPEDVAATVAYLASEEARFMTGTALQIGAGNQLMRPAHGDSRRRTRDATVAERDYLLYYIGSRLDSGRSSAYTEGRLHMAYAMRCHEPDIAEVNSVLPTPMELLRAVRGHSVETEGGPLARVVAKCALELAELHIVEQQNTTCAAVAPIRAVLLDHIDAIVAIGLPHVADIERREIRDTIERIALASIELHQALRQRGGTDEHVRALCRRTAVLADTYSALVTSAARLLPWSPPRI